MAFTFAAKAGARKSIPSRPAQSGKRRAWPLNTALILFVGAVGASLLFFGGPQRHTGLVQGQRAPSTLVSTMDFECVDLTMTALKRHQAADMAPAIFRINQDVLSTAQRAITKLVDRIVLLRQTALEAVPTLDEEAQETARLHREKQIEQDLDEASDLLGIPTSGRELLALFPVEQEKEVLDILQAALEAVWNEGILTHEERETGFQGIAPSLIITLFPVGAKQGVTRELNSIQEPADALDRFAEAARQALEDIGISAPEKVLRELIRPWVLSNLLYDARQTSAQRSTAERSVEPVIMTVRSGTTLMEEREIISEQTLEMLNAYYRRLQEVEPARDRLVKQAGRTLLLFLALGMCAFWEWITVSQIPNRMPRGARRKAVLTILAILAILITALYYELCLRLAFIPPWLAPYTMPMAAIAMLGCLLLGPASGLTCALWAALYADLVFGRGFEMVPPGIIAGVVAILLLRRVRKRAQVLRAGLLSGLLVALTGVAMGASHQYPPVTVLLQAGNALLAGAVAAILAMLLLPLLEMVSKYTTDITLLELTDVGHPLLRRLSLEAPGTYHHSLMVGTLAQAAAEAIGANSLLVGVCANFHDIGKMAKPEFFTENQRGGENPHDDLAPAMSALIIQSHVKEGVSLATRHKLPKVITRGIATHHGTSLTSFFYQIALRELREAGLPEDPGLEHAYRYPGPRPRTREEAILMLADTVEAASRSLEKPTPKHIADLVNRLISEKMADGQLDESALTLDELRRIRETLVFTLNNILHGRNPYPTEPAHPKPAENAASGFKGSATADPAARTAGVSD